MHRDSNNSIESFTAIVTFLNHKKKSREKVFHVIDKFKLVGAQKSGIAFDLDLNSILFEASQLLDHSTSLINNINKIIPSRISLVFHSHGRLYSAGHAKLKTNAVKNKGKMIQDIVDSKIQHPTDEPVLKYLRKTYNSGIIYNENVVVNQPKKKAKK